MHLCKHPAIEASNYIQAPSISLQTFSDTKKTHCVNTFKCADHRSNAYDRRHAYDYWFRGNHYTTSRTWHSHVPNGRTIRQSLRCGCVKSPDRRSPANVYRVHSNAFDEAVYQQLVNTIFAVPTTSCAMPCNHATNRRVRRGTPSIQTQRVTPNIILTACGRPLYINIYVRLFL